MSEQRWILHRDVFGKNPGPWFVTDEEGFENEFRESVPVVPESELSLSLAREQRLREALEKLESYASDYAKLDGLLNASWVRDKARDALSSVLDGERS